MTARRLPPPPGTLARRSVLGGFAACPLCAGPGRGALAADGAAPVVGRGAPPPGAAHWTYDGGSEGERRWGDLSPEFRACSLGTRQSPIDLAEPIRAELAPLAFEPAVQPLRVANTGHSIQVDCAAGGTLRAGAETYALQQFHFHHPSEHLLDGERFDMECHFVHRDEGGRLGVVGVLMRIGARNAALDPIWAAMPAREGQAAAPAGALVDPRGLLPAAKRYLRYAGSLTTPPCTEEADWMVLAEPVPVGRDQVERFAALFPWNARSVQPRHRRFLLTGGD